MNMNDLKMNLGVNFVSCKDCEKWYTGVEIYKMFEQGPDVNILLKYDKKSETFFLNEDALMSIIQKVNPMQQKRNLKIVSYKEWMENG